MQRNESIGWTYLERVSRVRNEERASRPSSRSCPPSSSCSVALPPMAPCRWSCSPRWLSSCFYPHWTRRWFCFGVLRCLWMGRGKNSETKVNWKKRRGHQSLLENRRTHRIQMTFQNKSTKTRSQMMISENQSINQSIHPLINQSINPLTNQSINQSITRRWILINQSTRRCMIVCIPIFSTLELFLEFDIVRWQRWYYFFETWYGF